MEKNVELAALEVSNRHGLSSQAGAVSNIGA